MQVNFVIMFVFGSNISEFFLLCGDKPFIINILPFGNK